jgi:dienelactone hydrolase
MKQMAMLIGKQSSYPALLLCAWACSGEPGLAGATADGARADPGAPNGTATTPAQQSALAGAAPAASTFADPTSQETSSAPVLSNRNPPPRGGPSSDTGGPGSASGGGSSDPEGGGATPEGGGATPDDGATPSLIRGDAPTAESASRQGPFQVTTFSAGLRDGPDYGTQTMHVPNEGEPPFAAVAVVPGFLAAESSIAAWGPFLASHGIVTLTIGTNSPTDSPDLRAKALLDALATIAAENARSGSPLEGKVDLERLGIMGWSMGGGGTLIASSSTPGLKAAITLAAWSPGVSFSDERVPVLLFAGGSDAVAGGQSQGFFTSIPDSTPKMLFEVRGGSHSVANSPNGGNGEVGRYGLSWLKVFLEGDERYRPFLLQEPTQDSDFRQNLGTP